VKRLSPRLLAVMFGKAMLLGVEIEDGDGVSIEAIRWY